ncbi:hypothetical protein K4K48_008328 [Colletotrichum sp. SAR 10_66]|nr:hypothetical protein K4K48_008328 [Colletotrichum sp. SAR 10_66]
MTTQTGPIETLFTKANSNFHNWWTEFKPSTQILPQGWVREPGRRHLKEDMIWEKDVAIPLRDGVKIRADIFRPAKLEGQKLPALLPWSPYGKTGSGDFYRESICRGGIPNFKFWDLLMQEFNGLNKREDVVTMIKKYPLMNEYWEDKKPKLQNIKIPMLRIHPTQEWFDIYQPETNDDLQRFLDHYLLAKDNGWELTPKVRLSMLRYNAPPISFRTEDDYPPSRVQYKTFYLNSSEGKLQDKAPATDAVTSYQSDSWEDDGAHFTLTFDKYTELCGFSRAKLFVSCQDFDDMDVYLIIRKIDRNGKALLNYNIPSIHQKLGQKPEDIPDENIYKYVGPSGRLRASKRMTAEEPGLTDEMRTRKNPTELWYPHYESQKVVPGDVVELDIAIWPSGIVFEEGESLRFEIKGHDPILPEYPPLFESLENLNVGKHNVHCGPSFPSYVMLPLISY